MGLFFVLVTATTAVGAVLLGWFMEEWGLMSVFLANAALVLAAGVVVLLVNRRLPSPDAASPSDRVTRSA